MGGADTLLAELEKNIDALLQERCELQKQVATLTEANNRQRDEMIRTHGELSSLRKEYNQLRMAHAMVADSEEREAVKRQLTRMITLVDKAIENLSVVDS